MSDRPCMLNPEKWRVARYVVPVPKSAELYRPLQLPTPVPAPPPVRVALWAIWPPQWPIEYPPMLIYPAWDMAFRAAFDRAQFATVPPVHTPQFDPLTEGPF